MSTDTSEDYKQDYTAAAKEAADASKTAEGMPTAHNHRQAAASHLAASVHAKAIGLADEMQAHDKMAQKHMGAMNACMAGNGKVAAAIMANDAKCSHLNEDGTFKGGFDGCVLHMQDDCGGSHSEESAKKICGAIAQNAAGAAGGKAGLRAAAAPEVADITDPDEVLDYGALRELAYAASTKANKSPGGDGEHHDVAAQAHGKAAATALAEQNQEAAALHEATAAAHVEKASKIRNDEGYQDPSFTTPEAAQKLQSAAFARMGKNAALEASVKDGGFSLNDLQQQIRDAVSDIAVLNQKPEGAQYPCSSVWVSDVIAPAHKAGESWEAIVQGADGKLYCVSFTVSKDNVEVEGEPKQVERVTDYDYVFNMGKDAEPEAIGAAAAAKTRALNASNPEGINQYTSGGGGLKSKEHAEVHEDAGSEAIDRMHKATPGSSEEQAHYVSMKAHAASEKAFKSGAIADHEKAAELHKEAAMDYKSARPKSLDNNALANTHADFAHDHSNLVSGKPRDERFITSRSAAPSTALEAGKASMNKYQAAAKDAMEATGACLKAHQDAASLHSIAAEHAKMNGLSAEAAAHDTKYRGHLAAVEAHKGNEAFKPMAP
jgi:hypothetical protein